MKTHGALHAYLRVVPDMIRRSLTVDVMQKVAVSQSLLARSSSRIDSKRRPQIRN